ncbi:MAG: cytochrome c-type biogenesis protein CcmH [Euryarchaeota archaeon]|nr:cytochrome c-type biogenesis protein CcmH [Euryarchaeota archaeon]MCG2737074.1 cytochrome c-type biogenesis protein CcmH [Candidatus Methanoperedenaceae archaeon]
MLKTIFIFILLISGIDHGMAEEGITSDLICPCECAMVISTCECTTAIQVKKEIAQMKENGFSENQIFSALQAEYGKDILKHPEKINSMLLWMAVASLIILFMFLGYIFTRRTKLEALPNIKRYEEQFEEEYRTFVSEMEEK